MVSIDLQQAGRLIGQPVVVLETPQLCEDRIQNLKSKTDEVGENRPRIIKQHPEHTRLSDASEHHQAPKQKQESRQESKHRRDGNPKIGKGHSDDRRPDTPRQKNDKHSDSNRKVEKNHSSYHSHASQPGTPKTLSKVERNSRHGEDKARDRERDKNRSKEKDRKMDKDRGRDRNKEKQRDKDEERDRGGDREKKNKTLLRDSCSKYSADGHTKSDSLILKQDRSSKSTDINGLQRTELLQNKKEKKNGDDGVSRKGGNTHSFETKPNEFPSYLLGGKSGSLKNFVIPKLKRDGKDKDPPLPKKSTGTWTEPLVRLERLSLMENLNKGAKPVVVVKKLSIDDVQRIMREGRNAHRSRNKSSFDQPVGGRI